MAIFLKIHGFLFACEDTICEDTITCKPNECYTNLFVSNNTFRILCNYGI